MGYRVCVINAPQLEADFIVSVLREAGYTAKTFSSIDKIVNEGCDMAIIHADFTDESRSLGLAKQIRLSLPLKRVGVIMLANSSDMPFLRQMYKNDAESLQVYDEILFFPISMEELLGNVERVRDIINKKL